jgi:hypothetical protein
MKQFLLCLAFLFGSTVFLPAQSRKHKTEHVQRAKTVHVRSYTKKNGTKVKSYYRAAPHRR